MKKKEDITLKNLMIKGMQFGNGKSKNTIKHDDTVTSNEEETLEKTDTNGEEFESESIEESSPEETNENSSIESESYESYEESISEDSGSELYSDDFDSESHIQAHAEPSITQSGSKESFQQDSLNFPLSTTQAKFMISSSAEPVKNSFQREVSEQIKNIQNSISRRSNEKRKKKHHIRQELLKAFQETQNQQPGKDSPSEFHQTYTPSFGEDMNVYTSFKSFGKEVNIVEGNAVKVLTEIHSQEDSEESSKGNKPVVILVNNDTDSMRAVKFKKWEQKKLKRIEELKNREQSRSPSRSPQQSPYASPKPLNRNIKISTPSSDRIRRTPSPINLKSEEVKKLIDEKYKRDNHLPKITYNKSSNRRLIRSAITGVCLAGDFHRNQRELMLSTIDKNKDTDFFIIVFNSVLKREIRALYSHDPSLGAVNKLCGPVSFPHSLTGDMVKVFYNFNSGTKEFEELQCSDFILGTDAVVLKNRLKLLN
ncbi:unnamed protein product [Blepharisma stoltei]|uniref:CKK domain-containing protein n=1 Tax=Blepharisma stoltei TaxID=1481888 RepID=A0AAU9IMT6_9CILI|nr:unnamed protein product [Blepharisma stoltei]